MEHLNTRKLNTMVTFGKPLRCVSICKQEQLLNDNNKQDQVEKQRLSKIIGFQPLNDMSSEGLLSS